MKKSIKCGIVAAVAVAAGFAAYQSHGSYGLQDNSLLMQNVEALAQAPFGPDYWGEENPKDPISNKAWIWNGNTMGTTKYGTLYETECQDKALRRAKCKKGEKYWATEIKS